MYHHEDNQEGYDEVEVIENDDEDQEEEEEKDNERERAGAIGGEDDLDHEKRLENALKQASGKN